MPSNRLVMWWFLASEVCVFGGLIVTFLLLRFRHPEWAADAHHAWFAIGATNTAVLLTSSLTMVLAHAAAERRDTRVAARWMAVTFLFGLAFLGFKSLEYARKIEHGLVPERGLYWSFYWLMTGLHAFHVIAGLVAIAIIALGVRNGRRLGGVEAVGLYWHFVDVVWIYLFPLLYLVG